MFTISKISSKFLLLQITVGCSHQMWKLKEVTSENWMKPGQTIRGMRCSRQSCGTVFGVIDGTDMTKKAFVCPAFKQSGSAVGSCGYILCEVCHSFHHLYMNEGEV